MCHYCQKLDELKSIDSRTTQQLYFILRRIHATIEPRFGYFFLKRFELTTRLHALLSIVYSKAQVPALTAFIEDTEHELLRLKKELSTHLPLCDVGNLKTLSEKIRPEESASRQRITTYSIPEVGISKMAATQKIIQIFQQEDQATASVKTWLGRTSPPYPSAMKKPRLKGFIETWLEGVELHRSTPRAPPLSRRNFRSRRDDISSGNRLPQSYAHWALPNSSEQTQDPRTRHKQLLRQRPPTEATRGHRKENHRAANEGIILSPNRSVTPLRNPTEILSTSTSELSLSNSGTEMVSKSSATNIGSLILRHITHDASYDNNQSVPRRVKFADEVTYSAYPQHATNEPRQGSQNSRYQHLSLLSTLSDQGNQAEKSQMEHERTLNVVNEGASRHVDRRRRPVDIERDNYRRKERERF